jgi:ectoine utilization protein EutC
MRRETLILREREILELLDPLACIAAMEQAFAAYSSGRAELPSVIHLDIPEHRGEIHIKTGHIHGSPYYAVKMVSGFPGNPELGLPPNDGMVVVLDAFTGAPAAFLLDKGLITDIRTAAAGAVVAKHLARREIHQVAVIGTGGQARYQTEMLARVRSFSDLRIWGRNLDNARARIEDLNQRGNLPPNCRTSVAETVAEAVDESDIVVTVTASREPLVQAEWLKPGVTMIAVGSDAPEKQELDVDVLARADRIVADSISQCLRLGEIHHAVEKGAIPKEKVSELGEIIAGQKPGRVAEDEIIVCDLTGVGVQDVAAASLVLDRAKAAGRGQKISLQ